MSSIISILSSPSHSSSKSSMSMVSSKSVGRELRGGGRGEGHGEMITEGGVGGGRECLTGARDDLFTAE